MHVVVNHLPIRPDADWDEIARKFEGFAAGVKARFPAMTTALLTRAGDNEALFVGIYDDPQTMQDVSSNVAGPWFAENIRQYLSGQANRTAATSIAGWTRASPK